MTKSPAQIAAESRLSEIFQNTGVNLSNYNENIGKLGGEKEQQEFANLLSTINQEGFSWNPEANDFTFNRTYGEETYSDWSQWNEFSSQRAMEGYDWNQEAGDFSFTNLGRLNFYTQDETGKEVLTPTVVNTPEQWEAYREQQASRGIVSSFTREPILDEEGNVTGFGAPRITNVNAIKWHTENSPNFTEFITPTGQSRIVFNGQSYDEDSLAAAVSTSGDANLIRQYAEYLDGNLMPGVEKPETETELELEFKPINYEDETWGTLNFSTPEELQDYIKGKLDEGWEVRLNEDGTLTHSQIQAVENVDPNTLQTILAGIGMASPGFTYSWDDNAMAEVEQQYGVATAEAVRNAVQARVDLANMRAEALNTFYGGKYASAAKIDKFGWTGGAESDERMRVAYLNASINSQMMNQRELIQAGYNSELAIAREYAQLNLQKLAEEKYQMAYANAKTFAEMTGYWISPETTDVMNNWFAAQGLPDSDPRKQAITEGVTQYLKAQGIDEATWIASQEFFRDLMSFNMTIEREMSELAKLSAERDYNLRIATSGVDPVTGRPIVRGTTTPEIVTNFPASYTDNSGTEFTRYAVDGVENGFVYFDTDGNAYEAEIDEEGNIISMELREEGAMKVVDGIEYFKDDKGVYRDAEGYDISQHPREGNTRRINNKLHTYQNGKWVLDPMYARASENWGKIQVFQETGTEPINIDTGTKPNSIHRRDWEALKNGYFKDGELVQLMRTNSSGNYDTYAGAKYDHYFIYEGQLYKINDAGVEAHSDMVDRSKYEFGNYAKFMSAKASTILSGDRITVAGMLVDLDSKTKVADAEKMGQLVLQAHQAGKLPNDTLINFGSDTSWHYIDGTFRKIEDDVWTKDLRADKERNPNHRTNLENLGFEGGVFVGERSGYNYGNNAIDKLETLIGGGTVEPPGRTTTPTVTQGENFQFEQESKDNTREVFIEASRDGQDKFWFNGQSYATKAEADAVMREFNRTPNQIERDNFLANFEATTDVGRNIVSNVDRYISETQTSDQVVEILSKYETSFVPFTLPAATALNRKEFKTLEDYINYRKNLGNNTSKIAELDKQIEFAVGINNTIKEKLGSFVGEGKEIPFPTFRQSFTAGNSATDITSLDELLERVRKTNNPEKVMKEFNERLDVVSGLYNEYGSGFKPFTVNYTPLGIKIGDFGQKRINNINELVNEHYRVSQLTLGLDVTRSTNLLLDAATVSQGRTPPNRSGEIIPSANAATTPPPAPRTTTTTTSSRPTNVTQAVDDRPGSAMSEALVQSRPVARTFTSASQPSIAASNPGDVWRNPSDGKSYIRVGTRWVVSGGGTAGSTNTGTGASMANTLMQS
jgi:hypothetical protein